MENWQKINVCAMAICCYRPELKDHVSLDVGDSILVLEMNGSSISSSIYMRGLIFHSCFEDYVLEGIFPTTHVYFLEENPILTSKRYPITPIKSVKTQLFGFSYFVIRDWNQIMYKCASKSPPDQQLFQAVQKSIMELSSFRLETKEKKVSYIVQMISAGNMKMGLSQILLCGDTGSIILSRGNVKNGYSIQDIRAMHVYHDPSIPTFGAGLSNILKSQGSKGSMMLERIPMLMIKFELQSLFPSISLLCPCVEFRFSIYSGTHSKYISEEFVSISDETVDLPKIQSRAVFTEFNLSDLSGELFIVCKVVKNAPLKDIYTNCPLFRRTVAVGVCDLKESLVSLLPQQNLGNYTSATSPTILLKLHEALSETGYSTMVEDLIAKKETFDALKSEPLLFTIKIMTDSQQNSSGSVRIQRRGLPEPVNPSSSRSSVYVTLESGELSRSLGKSFEVELSLRDAQNITQSRAIQVNSQQQSEYNFTTLYHCNSPKWKETVRVEIPAEKMSSSFLFFTVKFCSKSSNLTQDRKIAIGFKGLITADGSVVSEKPITIQLYKYDKKAAENTSLFDPKLTLIKDTLTISVFLVSAKHTQSWAIAKVLEASNPLTEVNPEKLLPVLNEFKNVESVEIGKFSVQCIRSFLNILCSEKEIKQEVRKAIFENFLGVLSKVYNERDFRFHYARSILQNYLENEITQVECAAHIMQYITQNIQKVQKNPKEVELNRELHSTFKCLNWFFLIFVRCGLVIRKNSKSRNSTDAMTSFLKTLMSFLDAINGLMADSADHLTAQKQFAFLNFANIFPMLAKVLPLDELVKCVILFVESSSLMRASLVQKKFSFILAIVQSEIFNEKRVRVLFYLSVLQWVTICVNWLVDPLTSGDVSLRLQIFSECVSILSQVCEKIQILPKDDITFEDENIMLNISECIPGLFESFLACVPHTNSQLQNRMSLLSPAPENSSPVSPPLSILSYSTQSPNPQNQKDAHLSNNEVLKIVTLFCGIHDFLPEKIVSQYFSEMYLKNPEKTTKYFFQLFGLSDIVYRNEICNSNWINLKMCLNRSIFKMFSSMHSTMKNFISSFDAELWNHYLKRITELLIACFPGNENWSMQTWCVALGTNICDVLSRGSALLIDSWASLLPESQLILIPQLVGSFFELSCVKNDEVFSCAVGILCSMIKHHCLSLKSKKVIESLIIDCLDNLVICKRKCDENYAKNLIHAFKSYFSNESSKIIDLLVQNIQKFLEMLLSFRGLPPGTEYEDEQWNGIFKIAKFMNSIERNDIYLKYIYHLADKQTASGNFLEAGWTLKLHADLLTWNDNLLDAAPELGFESVQKECERKEILLNQIIDYFEESKAWESAMEISKELVKYYEFVAYDYEKLAEIYNLQGRLCTSIIRQERYYSEYFRVGYYGMGFPPAIRNKQFIYRGQELEKIASFCEKIQCKHPDALLMKSNAMPDKQTLQSKQQWLQITAVQPEPDVLKRVLQSNVPESIQKFYLSNMVNRFCVSRPVKKGDKNSTNEFLSLWTEKTTYVTDDTFPHLLRRSEVVECFTTEISPLENAIRTMVLKNRDLVNLERKYDKLSENVSCNPFTMCINGAVDAPVNGGVNMYRVAFIQNSELNDTEPCKKLAEAIDEQVCILNRCIAIHNRIVPQEMRPLHENIVNSYCKNFAEEIQRLNMKVDTLAVPVANTKEKEKSRFSTYNFTSRKLMKKAETTSFQSLSQNFSLKRSKKPARE